MQHATAIDRPGIVAVATLYTQGQVLVELAFQTVGNVARSHILTILTKEGRVVDGEQHRHRRLVDGDTRQRLGLGSIGNGVANLEILDTHEGANVARSYRLHLGTAHTLEHVELLDALFYGRAVFLAQRNLHALFQHAPVHTAHGDTAYIRRVVERGDKHLGSTLEILRFGDVFDNGIEQRRNVVGRFTPVGREPPLLGRTVYGGEVELVFGCIEAAHQVEDHLLHLVGATVGLVDLVDNHNRLQPYLDSLLQDKPGLGHRALESVDQQQTAVGHVEHTLHLATEIGVPRSIYNIDFVILVTNRNILGENRDTSFALQIIIIQYQLTGVLVLAKKMSGQKHFVYQRRLAVVDVSDNRNVSDFLHITYFNQVERPNRHASCACACLYVSRCKVTIFF